METKVKPVNCNETMSVTSVTDLQNYALGTVVRLPDFAEGQPFVARVRRPSIMVLMKQGKVPNKLMGTAVELFEGSKNEESKGNRFEQLQGMFEVIDIVVDAALVEPTVATLKQVGLELTDEQTMAIFDYVQDGVKSLESFRSESEGSGDNFDGANVAEAAE